MVLFSITKHSYYCQRQHYLSLSLDNYPVTFKPTAIPLSNHLNVHNKLYNLNFASLLTTNNLIDHQFKMNRSSTFSSVVIDVTCPCFALNIDEDASYKNNYTLIKDFILSILHYLLFGRSKLMARTGGK